MASTQTSRATKAKPNGNGKSPVDRMAMVNDTLENFVTGLGTVTDKNYYNNFSFSVLSQNDVESAYRGDWVARKMVNIPAEDATSKWRAWQAEKDQITKIEEEEKRLGVQQKVKGALIKARLYGGSALIIGAADGNPEAPLDAESIKEGALKFLHVLNRYEITVRELERDVTSDFYGQPQFYEVMGEKGQVKIHPSRVMRFIGAEPPSIQVANQNSGWGDSVLQALSDAIKNVALTSQGIAQVVHESKIDVLSIPDFMDSVGTAEYKARLTSRVQLTSMLKSFMSTLIVDKDEKWERVVSQFGGLEGILKLYLQIASAAADIPVTRFLGATSPGLGSTGEGDLRNHYDAIMTRQNTEVSPVLNPLDDMIIRSALGTRPPEIFYNWSPLYKMREAEAAEVSYKKAQTFKIDADAGSVDADALRKARENQLIEDGTYPGLEAALADAEAAGIDETDPEVVAQFAGNVGPVPADLAKPQDQVLNGAQIASMVAIVEAVTSKAMPPETAKAMLAVAFPLLKPEQIDAIIEPLQSFEAAKPPPALVPVGPGATLPKRPGGPLAAPGEGPGRVLPFVKGRMAVDGDEDEIDDAGNPYHVPSGEHGGEFTSESGNGNKEFWAEHRLISIASMIRNGRADASTETLHLNNGGEIAARQASPGKSGRSSGYSGRAIYTYTYEGTTKTVSKAAALALMKEYGLRDSIAQDAQPRSLYVRRDVLNAAEIVAWAKAAGFETTLPPEEMHVTVVYSKAKVDWMKFREDWGSGSNQDSELTIPPGGPRLVERLGKTDECAVLMFANSALCWRHESIQQGGASWDWPEYQPHITITFECPKDFDLSKIESYRGEIKLGPEIWEEVKENWKESVEEVSDADDVEDSNPNHEPAGSEHGGEFASAEGAALPAGKLMMTEGHVRAYATGRHGEEERGYKRVDVLLTRGTKSPRNYGSIQSYITNDPTMLRGTKIASSMREIMRYRLRTHVGGESTHGSFREAMRRAEFERKQKRSK